MQVEPRLSKSVRTCAVCDTLMHEDEEGPLCFDCVTPVEPIQPLWRAVLDLVLGRRPKRRVRR